MTSFHENQVSAISHNREAQDSGNSSRDLLNSTRTLFDGSSRLDLNTSTIPTPCITTQSSNVDLSKTLDISPSTESGDTLPINTGTRSTFGRLNDTLASRHLDIIVVMTCFITGLTDSSMFANYSVFTSMQSGNTIFIALGTSQQNTHPFVWIRCLFSLFAYCLGCFFFSRLHNNWLAPKTRRCTVVLAYLIQAVFILISASLIQAGAVQRWGPSTNSYSPRYQWESLAPICLLSFQAGGQIMAARSLGNPEVPTVVVTSMLCELFCADDLFKKRNPGRDRRIAAFFCMLAGAIVGGWVDKASRTVQAALWTAAVLKFVCASMIAVWPAQPDTGVVGQEKGAV